MALANVIDRRTNSYNVFCDVVFEPSYHDNSIEGSSQFDKTNEFTVDDFNDVSFHKVLTLARKYKCPVTAYLYDQGSRPTEPTERKNDSA